MTDLPDPGDTRDDAPHGSVEQANGIPEQAPDAQARTAPRAISETAIMLRPDQEPNRNAKPPTQEATTPAHDQASKDPMPTATAVSPPPAPASLASNGATPVWERPFLEALAIHGTIEGARAAVQIGRTTVFERRRACPAFEASFHDSLARHADRLEAEAYRRAVEGVARPVFYAGERIGEVVEYSDALLIKALEGNRPEKYKHKADLSLSGPGGGAVQIKTEAEVKAVVQPYLPALEAVAASLLERAELERKAKLLEGPPPSE